jgi:hypothetical protein
MSKNLHNPFAVKAAGMSSDSTLGSPDFGSSGDLGIGSIDFEALKEKAIPYLRNPYIQSGGGALAGHMLGSLLGVENPGTLALIGGALPLLYKGYQDVQGAPEAEPRRNIQLPGDINIDYPGVNPALMGAKYF